MTNFTLIEKQINIIFTHHVDSTYDFLIAFDNKLSIESGKITNNSLIVLVDGDYRSARTENITY